VRVLGVIPARLAAVRFPRKPLADLCGRPLVQWVYEAAVACPTLDEVVVATPDEELADRVRAIGGAVEMTRDDHPTGTDRVAEVATRRLEADVVVNVQGDQPFVTPEMLSALIEPFGADEGVVMSTLGAPLDPRATADDPNTVKVVCDQHGDALYFSRSGIPYFRTEGPAPVFHHIGLYAFDRAFLATYAGLPPTPLEEREGLEQLRALEHGYRIRVQPTAAPVIEVNTPEDLDAARAHVEGR
jgi:3-deoxy-manno-octulosonate cytidylyltransferase (CMP-KDO synthetase)